MARPTPSIDTPVYDEAGQISPIWKRYFESLVDGTTAVSEGGTGATTALDARGNLGLTIGSQVQAYNLALDNLSNISGTGFVVKTGDDTFVVRTITSSSSIITVTNPDAVTGNVSLAFNTPLVDHDSLLNYIANEHIDWTSTTENLNTSGTVDTGDLNIAGDVTLSGTADGRDLATDGTKLDGIEALADVTDATNVDAAGAVMNSDTSSAAVSFVIDEDDMVSNSATKVPTQQSVKAYVDAGGGGLTQEEVEDYAGALVATGGTKSGIAVTYQDGTNDMDFIVSDTTVAGDSGSTAITPGDTLTIAGGTGITTAMSGDTLTVTNDITDTNDWVLISSATASSSATIEFTSGITSTYAEYRLIVTDLTSASDGVRADLRVSTDSGSTWKSGASDYGFVYTENVATTGATTASAVTGDAAITQVQIISGGAPLGTGAGEAACVEIAISNPAGTAEYTFFKFKCVNYDSIARMATTFGVGAYNATTAVNGIQFYLSTGNIATGNFRLYGLLNA